MGLTIPPCGTSLSVAFNLQSSRYPASSRPPINRRKRLSWSFSPSVGPARRATPSASGGASTPGAGGRGQFRIYFRGERVIEARDIREALRQVESLGTVEVTAVTREDCRVRPPSLLPRQ